MWSNNLYHTTEFGSMLSNSSCNIPMWHVSEAHHLLWSCYRGKPSNKAPSVAVMACIVNSSQSTAAPSPAQGDADIRSNGQASASGSTPFTPAVTPAVVASSSPVWSHCLSCEFGDGQMQTGLLQLALLDEADGSVITRYNQSQSCTALDGSLTGWPANARYCTALH